jgi:predicted helicase
LHYITDLHGNIAEGIYRDENVFDITEGVAILIAAQLPWCNQRRSFFQELIGTRDHKLTYLRDHNHKQNYQQIYPKQTNQYSFCPTEHNAHDLGFDTWPALHEIFTHYSSGVISARDQFSTDINRARLHDRIKRFIHSKNKSKPLLNEFKLKAKKGWSVDRAQMLLRAFLNHQDLESSLYPITYRPFIKRWICYHPSIVWTTAKSTQKHLLNTDNIALISMRQYKKSVPEYSFIFANKGLTEARVFSSQTGVASIFPLWLYSDDKNLVRTSNISTSFIQSLIGHFDEKSVYKACAYIYALLHSPIYRRLFGEQLKRSFPHIPPTCDPHLLEALVICGAQLLSLHTTQDNNQPTKNQPPINLGPLEKVIYSTDRLKIIGKFGDLDMTFPSDIWLFNIGGYQVLKTWFKHMRGQHFNEQAFDELQKLIECLQQTINLQSKIDAIIMHYGGFHNGFKTNFS